MPWRSIPVPTPAKPASEPRKALKNEHRRQGAAAAGLPGSAAVVAPGAGTGKTKEPKPRKGKNKGQQSTATDPETAGSIVAPDNPPVAQCFGDVIPDFAAKNKDNGAKTWPDRKTIEPDPPQPAGVRADKIVGAAKEDLYAVPNLANFKPGRSRAEREEEIALNIESALYWRNELGFAAVPKKSGAKWPPFPWKEFEERLPTVEEIEGWGGLFLHGVGFVTGAVSGNAPVEHEQAKRLHQHSR